jgi:short-subunit dehydrogenase
VAAGKREEASGAGHAPALVTGASSGIGAAFAARLARDGYDLVVVARRRARLEGLAAGLRAAHGGAVEVLVADLARPSDLRAVEARVAAAAPEVLVNNAGYALDTPFADTDVDATEAQLRVNVVALVRLTRAALPGMLARGRGAIINVSSVAAFLATPGGIWTTYAATKAFVNAFTRGVDRQVRPAGVRVQALCPGWTRTELLDRLGHVVDAAEAATMAPEALVEASLAGLRQGEVVCAPSLDDPDLLRQIDELQATVLRRAASTGSPAPRYRNEVQGPGSQGSRSRPWTLDPV